MDGAPVSAQLPPPMMPMPGQPPPPPSYIPGMPGQQQQQQQQMAPQQPAQPRPVGRPSSDPEQQQQREERVVDRQRLVRLLPKEMTDSRIAVYRLMGRVGTQRSPKPVMKILFAELEPIATRGDDTGEYIKARIGEEFPTGGRFVCEPQDRRGRLIPESGAFDVTIENTSGEELISDEEEEIMLVEERPAPGGAPPRRPGADYRVDKDGYALPPAPPPITGNDLNAIIDSTRKATHDQHARDQSATGLLMQMMMMNETRRTSEAEERRREDEKRAERDAQREQQRQEREARQEKEDAERRRTEENERRERDREERKSRQTMLLALGTAAVPIISKMMEGKPDTVTPMLMKMMDSKNDRDGTKELFGIMSEANKQSMVMQGEASKHMLAAQAEASKMLISNILGISKQMVEATLEAQSGDAESDDPMDKMAKIFKIFGPAIASLGGGAQAQGQVNAAAQGAAPAAIAAPAAGRPAPQPQVTEAQWIQGGLVTIMQLETGHIPREKRLLALKWCADNLPTRMLTAIRSGDENQVMAVGAEGMNQQIQQWLFGDEQHTEFLRGCIADIQRMLLGAMDETAQRESIARHDAYFAARPPVGDPTQAKPVEASVSDGKPKKRAAPPPPADVQLAEPIAQPTPPAAPAKEGP